MKKRNKVFAVLVLCFALLTGCSVDGSVYAGIGVITFTTDTTWNISWVTMEGRVTETLFRDEETVLQYSIEAEAEEMKVWVEADDSTIELPLDGTELSLEDYKDDGIKIVVEVKGGKDSKLHFKLK